MRTRTELTTLFRQTGAGLRLLLVLTVLLGIGYPFAVYGVSRIPWLQESAEGSAVARQGPLVESPLIGIDPVAKNAAADPYFHTRPSAAELPSSGGSNLSGDSAELRATIATRQEKIAQREGVTPQQIPVDAVTASGSGLDPDISPDYAALQAPRVARVNHLAVDTVRGLIAERTSGRQLGVLGEPIVNVVTLNLAVCQAAGAA